MVLCWEEELECEVCVDGAQLEQISEYTYCILKESGIYNADCRRKVASVRKGD